MFEQPDSQQVNAQVNSQGQPGPGQNQPVQRTIAPNALLPNGLTYNSNTQSIFNPNTQQGTDVANAIAPFLQSLFQNPQHFMQGIQGMASPLQQQAVGNMGAFLNQPAPETRALSQAQPMLQGLMGGLQNPNANAFGGFSAGQQTVNAAQPVFQQNLQGALTQVANRAPSVRNSAFGDQAGGLAQRALGDFNLFQQQALQQGQQLDLAQAGQNQQFALGAGGLQLGAGGLLGQLASQAGNNPFQRMLGAGQLGNQISQGNVNSLLQLMMGGMQFGQAGVNPLEAIIRQHQQDPDRLGQLMQLGGTLGSAAILASSKDHKEDIRPLTPEDDEAALVRLADTSLYLYRYKGSNVARKGLILEDPTTPEELKYGAGIDLYSFVADLTSAVRALSRKLEKAV
jgi:hypothetical protein